MADIIKESVYLMHSKASHYDIKMNIDYPSLQFLAEVDNRRLKRVFINVIMNAIDAMPGGGSLKIAAQKNEDYSKEILQNPLQWQIKISSVVHHQR